MDGRSPFGFSPAAGPGEETEVGAGSFIPMHPEGMNRPSDIFHRLLAEVLEPYIHPETELLAYP
jgi:hypothetical protein